MKKFLNFIKNPKLKMICILAFLLFIYTTICAISYAKSVSEDLENSVFRLHVIANSDSKEDQNLKYIVRDKLLQYMNSYLSNTSTKEDAIKIANKHLDEFKQVAINTIKEQGYSYNVNVKVGNFEFPTKTYGDISLPAGFYDALRVEIGEAKGQNWWCVMFPSLCFIDISSGIVDSEGKEKLENNLDSESYELISESKTSTEFKLKFKLLEVFSHNGLFTAKN